MVKVTARKNTSNVSRSVKKAVKKALKKAGRQRKNITVRLKSKSKKNITLKLDKSTIRFLTAKRVKSVQWDRGKTRVTMSLKKLKKVNKRMLVNGSFTKLKDAGAFANTNSNERKETNG